MTNLKHTLSFIAVIVAVSLSGCSTMNSSFDCKKVDGKGVGCSSVESVNQMANAGAFNEGSSMTPSSIHANYTTAGPTGYPTHTPNAGELLRSPEHVQRIWIAPWQDKQGIYHEPAYVALVVSPSHWLGFSTDAIQKSGE